MDILDLQPVHLDRAAAAGLRALGDEQVTAYVTDRYVVLGVERPFPHVPGCSGIKDRFPTQQSADAARYRFDMIHRSEHFRVVAHSDTPLRARLRRRSQP